MDRRIVPLAALALGLGIGAGVALWLRPEAEIVPVVVPHTGARVDIELEEPAPNPGNLPRVPPSDLLPPEAETHPEYFAGEDAEPAGEQEPESLPAEVDYAVLDKLSVESEVPHQTVGAWDEAPDSAAPGLRRAFVVVVEPSISDANLEALARDLRAQHGDARILSVRIYDSEKGARRAGWVDGGALAHRHLVAQVSINQAQGLDLIRVRGRKIEP
ncbi:MAG: hypothetical protein ACQGVK_23340 [Myxococcota bacterium]